MARAMLSETEEHLVQSLQNLRWCAGWTIRQTADSLNISLETLRGVLFRKNRPGPLVLERTLAFGDRANPRRLGPHVFTAAQETASVARELLGPQSQEDLLDSIYRRVASDFEDLQSLLDFTGVDSDQWQQFAAGAEPGSEFLEALDAAYSNEAARIAAKDSADATWCRQIAALAARAMDRVLT